MTKISVFDTNGKEIEKIDLPSVFDTKVNKSLLAQAVRVYLANQRQGTASTKTRGEVQGSTRKIYRQKGTGRARHGSIRAPIFRKGGIVFGPKPRDYRLNFPQKMRKAALNSAYASKLLDKAIIIVDGLNNLKPKTKEMVKVFKNLKLVPDIEKILLVISEPKANLILSARNIEKTTIKNLKDLNAYEVLNNKKLLFTKEAILSLTINSQKKPLKKATIIKSSKI